MGITQRQAITGPMPLLAGASRLAKRLRYLALLLAIATALALGPHAQAKSAGLEVEDLREQDQEDLLASLLGEGVVASNVAFTGATIAAGTFTGGTGIIGFESGIILSTGSIHNVVGPNEEDGVTYATGADGDPDLDALVGGLKTFDAAVLEFDFVPSSDVISFQYVFASDEYNDFVGSPFNDAFGFFVNGVNVALVPGTNVPVSVNNVNKGKPFGTRNFARSPEYYINNDLDDGGGLLDTEMDGMTVVLSVVAQVRAGELNHIKLAIADTSDRFVDSNVFIRSGSFSGSHPPRAMDDFASTLVDSPVYIEVLANDFDIDGDRLSLSGFTQPANGSTEIAGADVVRYIPRPGFTGTDTFRYTVNDARGGSASATVTVEVRASTVQPPGAGEAVVNHLLQVVDVTVAYDSGDARGSAGVVVLTATIRNASERELTALRFEVAVLTGGHVVLNAEGRPGGAGSQVPVPKAALGDGVLSPGESFTQRFEIGLAARAPFSFFVNVLGES